MVLTAAVPPYAPAYYCLPPRERCGRLQQKLTQLTATDTGFAVMLLQLLAELCASGEQKADAMQTRSPPQIIQATSRCRHPQEVLPETSDGARYGESEYTDLATTCTFAAAP